MWKSVHHPEFHCKTCLAVSRNISLENMGSPIDYVTVISSTEIALDYSGLVAETVFICAEQHEYDHDFLKILAIHRLRGDRILLASISL